MKAGRQRRFELDIALEKAMQVFWQNGYSGTSLADLTSAMGINKPSLYSAFGNKEALFNNALNFYVQKYGVIHMKYLFIDNVSLRERIRCYLKSIADVLTNSSLPGGCFICSSICEMQGESIPSGSLEAVKEINIATKSVLTEFFNAEILEGNVNGELAADLLADYLMTLQMGLAVMAKNGSKSEDLGRIIDYSLAKF